MPTHKKRKPKLCIRVEVPGQFPVELRQAGKDNFRVVYGQQVSESLSYNDAAADLGACIMHALACASKLDNG